MPRYICKDTIGSTNIVTADYVLQSDRHYTFMDTVGVVDILDKRIWVDVQVLADIQKTKPKQYVIEDIENSTVEIVKAKKIIVKHDEIVLYTTDDSVMYLSFESYNVSKLSKKIEPDKTVSRLYDGNNVIMDENGKSMF